jgi:hypothetical protein
MTPLRAKYIRDLTVRGRGQRTQRAYTRYVSELAHYYQRSPELISYEEVTNSRASHIQPKTSVKDRRVLSLMGVRARNGKYSVNGISENKARLALETVSRVAGVHEVGYLNTDERIFQVPPTKVYTIAR